MCPKCGESSEHSNKLSIFVGRDGKWRCRCFACKFGGDVIDFVAAVEKVTLGRAIRILSGEMNGRARVTLSKLPKASHRSSGRETDPEAVKEICRVAARWRHKETLRNLLDRRIPQSIVDDALDLRLIAALPKDPHKANDILRRDVGPDLMYRAKLLKETESKWSAAAFRPLVGLLDTAIQFGRLKEPGEAAGLQDGPRYMLYGELRWPYVFRRRPGSRLAVVEGIIDSLSIMAIDEYVDRIDAVLGVPGTSHWQPGWVSAIATKYKDAQILIGFDRDEAGETAYEEAKEDAAQAGLSVERILPPRGKDWNESLPEPRDAGALKRLLGGLWRRTS